MLPVAWEDQPAVDGVEWLDDFPSLVMNLEPSTRILRGDFEAPSTLVVAYEHDWVEQTSQIVAAARGQAKVVVLATDSDLWWANQAWGHLPYVGVLRSKLDSPWVRDYGPLSAYDEHSERAIWLDFRYALDRPRDDQVPALLSAAFVEATEQSPFALDGGAVVSNGAGLCAITQVTLTDLQFDDQGDRAQEILARIGCQATAVLPLVPEETTGHSDVVVQFLDETLAMVAWVDPADNRDLAEALNGAADNLAMAADFADQILSIVRVPIEAHGEVFYSYVNATRLRSRMLVPHFSAVDTDTEQSAYAAIEAALPGVELVAIDADKMAELGGAVHCVTLGLPSTRHADKGIAARFARNRARLRRTEPAPRPARRRRG